MKSYCFFGGEGNPIIDISQEKALDILLYLVHMIAVCSGGSYSCILLHVLLEQC